MTPPCAGGVHIWCFDLDKEAPPELLSADERARAARFGFERDACRWRAGRSLLRRTLGGYLNADPAALEFEAGPFGKPFLPGCSLRFNVSHSGPLFLLAFAWNQEIGIDAECLRTDFAPEDLATQVFSPAEQDMLCAAPFASRHAAFLSHWTAKEAYVKALGLGLSFPLQTLTLTLGSSGRYEAEDRRRASAGAAISVCRLPPLAGFAASLAVSGALTDIQFLNDFYDS